MLSSLSLRWVAYENPDFTGEQYILDKGLYPSIEAWGGKNCKISSVQPIVMVRSSFHSCFASFSEVFLGSLFYQIQFMYILSTIISNKLLYIC